MLQSLQIFRLFCCAQYNCLMELTSSLIDAMAIIIIIILYCHLLMMMIINSAIIKCLRLIQLLLMMMMITANYFKYLPLQNTLYLTYYYAY